MTNEGYGGTRSYEVSRHLVRLGNRVTMVCGLSENSGLAPMPFWRLLRTQWIDGIKLVVCNVPYSNKMCVPARLWSFFWFAILATWAALREHDTDLVFATSTPLTVAIPGRISATFLSVPFVFEVRDLWPEDLLAAGRIKPGIQCTIWAWMERFAYQRASRILLVSKGFHDRLLERGYSPRLLRTILLGADGSLYERLEPDNEYFARQRLTGKTIAVYTGAHGDANGLPQVIEAADLLRDRPDIAFVLLGDGSAKPKLKDLIAERGLNNVYLLDPVKKTELPNILAASHIGLMILKQIVRPRWVTPNKLFDYMFAGLPTIVNFPGTTAELVEEEGVGVAVEPGSAQALAEQIRYWTDHPDEAQRIGQHARRLAFAKFDRGEIARRLAEVFEDVLRETRRRG